MNQMHEFHRFKPGQRVMIDLELAQQHSFHICPSCGRVPSAEEWHGLLRYYAEVEMTIAPKQNRWTSCCFCLVRFRRSKDLIAVEMGSSITFGLITATTAAVPVALLVPLGEP